MALHNQHSDSAQNGGASGTKVTTVTPRAYKVSVPLSNGKSGESQGTSRGKQGTK